MLGLRSYIATRRAAYTVTDGRAVPGASTVFPIMASVQPVSGRIRQTLPEGIRQDVSKVAYTKAALRGPDHMTGLPADRLTIMGEEYEVADVQMWPDLLNHHQVALIRVQEQGGQP